MIGRLLFDIIAPHECLVCGDEGGILCGWCAPDAFSMVASSCFHCGSASKDFRLCNAMKRHSPLSRVWFSTHYQQNAKKIVSSLKYQQKREAAAIITNYMHGSLPYFDKDYVVIPIPTANNRVRERGFDHAQMIARRLAGSRQLICYPALSRLTSTRQVGVSKKERQAQAEGMFRVRLPMLVQRKKVLLVDDVVTTGATLESAARVLKGAGAASVDAAVFARSV